MVQLLGDKLEIIEFNDMLHGWTVRGDLKDPLVKRYSTYHHRSTGICADSRFSD
jgi:hypothetical protein